MRESRSQLASLGAVLAIVLPVPACVSTGTNTTMRTPNVPVSTTIETRSGKQTLDLRSSTASLGADVPLPLEQAWAALPKVYDDIGLTRGGATDPTSRTYGVLNRRVARIAGKRLSVYLDCGDSMDGPRADVYDVRITSFSSLTEKDGGTHIETLVQATAKPRGVSGNSVRCRSRATLEALIAERLGERGS
jgi:hypothetical protein